MQCAKERISAHVRCGSPMGSSYHSYAQLISTAVARVTENHAYPRTTARLTLR